MVEIAIIIIAEIFVIAAPIAAILWETIIVKILEMFVNWIVETLESNFPEISESKISLAFTVLSKVASSMYATVQSAWRTLRKYLLELIVYFDKNSSGQWVKKSTSKLIKMLKLGKPVVVKREVEEQVDWDELPDDIRAQKLRFSNNHYEVNFAEIRDKEMEVLSMTN